MNFKIYHTQPSIQRYLCLWYLLLNTFFFSIFISTEAQAQVQEIDEKEFFTPSFKSGHNLSLFLSGEYNTWMINQAPNTPLSAKIESVEATRTLASILFRYSYHINILSSFGFFVGSTVGLFSTSGSYGGLTPSYGISFPTVLGGLVQHFGEKFRFLTGIEYGAVWFPDMEIKTQSGASQDLNAVPDMFSIFAGGDYFLTPTKAFSMASGYRQIAQPCLNRCSNSLYLNSLQMKSKAYFVQLGLTWLISDFKNH